MTRFQLNVLSCELKRIDLFHFSCDCERNDIQRLSYLISSKSISHCVLSLMNECILALYVDSPLLYSRAAVR